ncbi:putative ribulose-phosphate 3-epimerase [uncultured Pleomorphomonas sp.]|uniref:Putative ribulose-phosphate 3-epimerase n=1 Tax=uncultured Pleomorphomonas sp. TaxID=442121 RepID=A0A212LLI3_9HYPH|nr:ribulose-phosphate 3-epimerase [uncultured Pleomorphomonas sp.]SCM78358.1 putative ribulose-phosphate 3-epimerase [uncultured Pleomorphomonas sp.]
MSFSWRKSCIVAPSLICLDLCNLQAQVEACEAAGIEVLHVDIIDGHFSPSLPLGLETVRRLRQLTRLKFDVHLMATDNDYFVDELIDIGVEQLVFHLETERHVDNQLNRIRAKGVRAGVALKPSTPVGLLDCVVEKCDAILLMLINPGYAWNKGEKQVAFADRKIRELRALIDACGSDTAISIDGRVSTQNIADYGAGLVDIFVGGTTCISRDDIAGSVGKLNALRATFAPL